MKTDTAAQSAPATPTSEEQTFDFGNLTVRDSLRFIWRDVRRILALMQRAAPNTLGPLAWAVGFEALAITALPFLTRMLIDSIAAARAGGDSLQPYLWLGLEAFCVSVRFAAAAAYRHRWRILELNAGPFLTGRILEKGCCVPYPLFESPAFLNRFVRARQDAPHYGVIFISFTMMAARHSLAFVGCFALLLVLGPWWIAPVVLLAHIPQFLLELNRARRSFALERENMDRNRQSWYLEWLMSTSEPMKEVRAFGMGRWLVALHERVLNSFRAGQAALSRRHLRITNGMLLATHAVMYVPYLFYVWRATEGEISLGTLLFFVLAFSQCAVALSMLLNSLSGMFEHHLYVHNMLGVLDEPEEDSAAPPNEANVVATAPEFRIDDLWFSYAGAANPVLKGLTLQVRAGETLAIVGRNGVGKTTLVKLLLGLYRPQKGRILIGDVDTASQPRAWQRDNIGVVFQDFTRYPFSVRDGVGVGWCSGEDPERVRRALAMADADSMVSELAQGDATALGPAFGGRDLSGGQWQRLALARLFMRKSRVWIMDEPTSAMDPETEERTFKCFRQWTEGRTAIIITHRFSTARIADRIAVVDEGRVTELGTHEELMALGGHYAHIFELQMQAFTAVSD